MFRRTLVVLAAAMIVASIAGAASRPSNAPPIDVVVGFESDCAPYEFLDPAGLPSGFAIDLLRAVASASDLRLHFITGTRDDLRRRLAARKIQIVPSEIADPAREAEFDFSIPYQTTNASFFHRRGTPVPLALGALGGERVAVVRGSFFHDLLTSQPGAAVVAADSAPDCLRAVADGRADLALGSRAQGGVLIEQLGLPEVEAAGPLLVTMPVCFAVADGNVALLARLNEGLTAVIASGTYGTLLTRYFGQGGGDRIPRSTRTLLRWGPWVAGAAALLLILLMLATMFLGREVRRRTARLDEQLAERKGIEAALRDSEDKFRGAAHASSFGLVVYQGEQVLYANPAAQKITACSVEELEAARLWHHIRPRRPLSSGSFPRIDLHSGPHPDHFEIEFTRGDGDVRVLDASVVMISLAGAPAGVLTFGDITDMLRIQRIQAALYDISAAASAADSLENLFALLHTTVARLMPAANFYIALRDGDSISFPYFVDTVDETHPTSRPLGRGLTEYVLRTRRGLLATPEVFDHLVASGEVESLGAPSIDWLGVPLEVEDEVIGTLVLQTYEHGKRYQPDDLNVLALIAAPAAQAIARTRFHQAIRESQRAMATLLANLPGMAYRCAFDDNWTMAFVSEGCRDLTGWTPAELVGNAVVSYADIIHPADRDSAPVFAAVASGRPFDLEYRIITRSGEEKRVWERGRAVRSEDGRVEALEGIIVDMTEQFRTAAALRDSERRYRLLAEHMADVVWVFNVDCGRFVFVSPSVERLCGLTVEDAIGRRLDEIVAPPSLPTLIRRFARRARQVRAGRPSPGDVDEVEVMRREGGTVWAEVVSTAVINERDEIEVIGVSRDITGRRQAEAALRRSEERYRLALQATRDVMYDLDLVRDAILWNPNLTTALGWSVAEMGPSVAGWIERIHPDDRCRVEAEFDAAVASLDAFVSEYRFARKDGSWATMFDRGLILRDEGGRAVRMVGAMSDLTDRKALEEQLQMSQRLETVGRLAGGVAHDFNNMLTAILGSTELLNRHLDAAHPGRAEVATIQRTAERAAELTRGLLAFGRRQVARFAETPVNPLIEQALLMIRRTLPETITVEFVPSPEAGALRTDTGQFTQILLNLCVNARDAMPTGGRLRIATASAPAADVGIVGGADGRAVVITVEDDGHGIAADDLPRIFEPFFTTKGVGKGSGMGLAIVYGLVQGQGGTICVTSERDRGTCFTVALPAADLGDALAAARATVPAEAVGGSETIVIAEDERDVREILVEVLAGLGYRVLAAADGVEAMAILTQHADEVDLILSDIVMPRMGGKELYNAARTMAPRAKFLFSSGYNEDAIDDDFIKAEGVFFLAKPYSIDLLCQTVRAILGPDPLQGIVDFDPSQA